MYSQPARQGLRAPAATPHRDFFPILPWILLPPVSDVVCQPPLPTENLCRIVRFLSSVFSSAASPHLSAREIENAGLLPALRRFEQCTATRLFDIIPMRGNGKNVQGLGLRKGSHVSRDCPAPAPRSPSQSAGV